MSQFLKKGEPPVYVGFGSMFNKKDTQRVATLVSEALNIAGKRGILGGMAGAQNLPEHVVAIDSVPHSWLFPRMALVCHHGGAGTTATGFWAGVPMVIVPFALDQFAWATRAYELGVGSQPLPFKQITAQGLAQRFEYASQKQIIDKAKALGRQVASESGASECAKIMVELLEGYYQEMICS